MADSLCIAKCGERINRAHEALQTLESSTSLEQTVRAWSDFLIAASTVYSKLEQGTKNRGDITAWFGRVKKERKDDPLLSYIHHARNSDEHGIANITKINPTTVYLEGPTAKTQEYTEFVVRKKPYPSVSLVTVFDERYGDSFDPPAFHQGMMLLDISPLGIAKLAYDYIYDLISTAKAMGV